VETVELTIQRTVPYSKIRVILENLNLDMMQKMSL
jgi:hypothetical protein